VTHHARNHVDGTACLAGTSSLPPRYRPCCETFDGHVETCAYDLRYEWWPRQRGWVVAIAESVGGGGIAIRYCPHCGAELRREAARKTPMAALLDQIARRMAPAPSPVTRRSGPTRRRP